MKSPNVHEAEPLSSSVILFFLPLMVNAIPTVSFGPLDRAGLLGLSLYNLRSFSDHLSIWCPIHPWMSFAKDTRMSEFSAALYSKQLRAASSFGRCMKDVIHPHSVSRNASWFAPVDIV
ncbi:hypothetical protein CPB84DRAFT_1773915 [Gymnopilus junonius]|uniref:Uncharacterized protein n=1 Tax=Gymnopilus junonius TaxID=109634 RepID=A0A9P5NNY1_GYMJU|nr:hypothetical protein CPB84DRAFT_1773915 [Gymnopilus junonius]